jgi:hypothetical protein
MNKRDSTSPKAERKCFIKGGETEEQKSKRKGGVKISLLG